ncbi:hypothetical protein ACFOW1_01870 [Parasediminibacterium paludis]|uniref:Uncharacterized protein n=1 Tax=Parasediminibacterium paludis TaxID=908966 RepID=A0ABV8PV47_9BACT
MKLFVLDSSFSRSGYNKTCITYLGIIKSKENKSFKILSWGRIWGTNRHTTGVILVYDSSNEYIGKYILGSFYDLPNKIKNNRLYFFKKKNSNCNSFLITKIDFNDGPPKEIYIKCMGNLGDIYSFSK